MAYQYGQLAAACMAKPMTNRMVPNVAIRDCAIRLLTAGSFKFSSSLLPAHLASPISIAFALVTNTPKKEEVRQKHQSKPRKKRGTWVKVQKSSSTIPWGCSFSILVMRGIECSGTKLHF
tara:strand:+ start:502 stop:861 length:360 start_codon:yes stop_codon:yes gene_type:complete